ncbi:MAG: hypothetical protein GVY22_11300 [Gammaproteobacteria bacterium]|jgi:hypothetical protein|nr:hypothetical protein [Gammaproteobacteria bacterium]
MALFPPQLFLALRSRLTRPWVERAERKRYQEALHLATDRLIDQVEPELRSLPHHHERLAPVVERIRDYSIALIDELPGPIALDKDRWATDPLLGLLFKEPSTLSETLAGPVVRKWLQENQEDEATELFGLLLARPKERTQLGVEVRGDRLEHDVKQTTLSFTDLEIAAVDSDLVRLNLSLRRPISDLIHSLGVSRLAGQEERIASHEDTLRMLQLKLKVFQPRADGIDLLLATRNQNLAEVQRLSAKITETERALVVARRGLSDLEQYFERVIELLAFPEEALQLEPMRVWLDRMNVLRDSDDPRAREVELMRAVSPAKPGRILMLVRFPRARLAADGEQQFPLAATLPEPR